MFKLNIATIKNEHDRTLGFEITGDLDQLFQEEAVIKNPVTIRGKMTNISGELVLQGRIQADMQLMCARCLKMFPFVIDKEVIESFGHAAGVSKRGGQEEEEKAAYQIKGDEVDLQPLIEETIVLNLPMKYLCSANCQGLCPICGCDLNQTKCNCKTNDIDPRLEILKKLQM